MTLSSLYTLDKKLEKCHNTTMTNKAPLGSIMLFPLTFSTWSSAELAILPAIAHEPSPSTRSHYAVLQAEAKS